MVPPVKMISTLRDFPLCPSESGSTRDGDGEGMKLLIGLTARVCCGMVLLSCVVVASAVEGGGAVVNVVVSAGWDMFVL